MSTTTMGLLELLRVGARRIRGLPKHGVEGAMVRKHNLPQLAEWMDDAAALLSDAASSDHSLCVPVAAHDAEIASLQKRLRYWMREAGGVRSWLKEDEDIDA